MQHSRQFALEEENPYPNETYEGKEKKDEALNERKAPKIEKTYSDDQSERVVVAEKPKKKMGEVGFVYSSDEDFGDAEVERIY